VKNTKHNLGFTLLELMIVVAIVAILSALAYPSYTEYIDRGRRSDARAVLLEAAQVMERRFTETRDYRLASLPTPLQKSPRDATKSWYNITISEGVEQTRYELRATPVLGYAPVRCGTLIFNHLGQKSQTSGTTDDCWYK
jgi:type IV pilus assembly protein PilE